MPPKRDKFGRYVSSKRKAGPKKRKAAPKKRATKRTAKKAPAKKRTYVKKVGLRRAKKGTWAYYGRDYLKKDSTAPASMPANFVEVDDPNYVPYKSPGTFSRPYEKGTHF